MDSLEQKRLGLRIKSIRILTGLNQEEFAKACDFNHTSLRNWEFGRVAPRKDAIDRLLDAFRSFSIFVDREWVFWGKGEGPVFTCGEQQADYAPSNEIAAFKKTCETLGETPLIFTLEDEEMAPNFCKGDVIGATAKSLRGLLQHPKSDKILSKPLLIKGEDKKFYLRRICFDGNQWFFRSDNSMHLWKVTGDVVGIVTMHISSNL